MELPGLSEVRVTLDGLNEAVIPEGTVAVSDTEPANSFRLFRVITEVSEEPTGIVSIDGLVETTKSGGSFTAMKTSTE